MSVVETRNLKLETRRIRTCSHIKVNGTKCGSPALRHQTLCYFHYQWDRRERRRVRLGGPVGTNKNTGIDLPILEGPESIMIALMEVQHALLDARIDRQTAHTLLYSLQLAMPLKISTFTGLSSRLQSVSTCPELESDLDLDRARGLRPSREVCSTCPDLDTCISPEACSNMPSSRPESRSDGAEGPAFSTSATNVEDSMPASNFCHAGERSDEPSLSTPPLSISRGPAVEARNLKPETPTVIARIKAAAAPERKQKALRLRAIPPRSAQGDTSVVSQENRHFANHALKGVADHEPSLRDAVAND